MSNNQITYINVNNIYPHPNNPRKNLGDLTELAESIKSNGIMQNLTVVPWVSRFTGKPGDNGVSDGDYTAVIGHRRLAAAKLAGLSEVPCIISDIDIKAQVATMLLENIQRSDLSITEEAEGFQMMLDLGESVSDISTQTGFSETTIRRRIKLLELDGEKFKESVERGGTLQDYAELDKIKDPDLKNKVLEKIGTANFKWELEAAIKKEREEKDKCKLIEILDTFAECIKEPDSLNMTYVQYLGFESDSFDVPDDASERKYYYKAAPDYIELWAEKIQTESSSGSTDKPAVDPVQEAKNREMQERREKLREIAKRAYMLRYEFIANYTGVKKHAKDIMEFAAQAMLEDFSCEDDVADLLGIEIGDDPDADITIGKIIELFTKSPERALLSIAYCLYNDSESFNYTNYDMTHGRDSHLDTIYKFLGKFGYQMSDEERALQDGTHELYIKDEKQE